MATDFSVLEQVVRELANDEAERRARVAALDAEIAEKTSRIPALDAEIATRTREVERLTNDAAFAKAWIAREVGRVQGLVDKWDRDVAAAEATR
jgi:hypothetical protein